MNLTESPNRIVEGDESIVLSHSTEKNNQSYPNFITHSHRIRQFHRISLQQNDKLCPNRFEASQIYEGSGRLRCLNFLNGLTTYR